MLPKLLKSIVSTTSSTPEATGLTEEEEEVLFRFDKLYLDHIVLDLSSTVV